MSLHPNLTTLSSPASLLEVARITIFRITNRVESGIPRIESNRIDRKFKIRITNRIESVKIPTNRIGSNRITSVPNIIPLFSSFKKAHVIHLLTLVSRKIRKIRILEIFYDSRIRDESILNFESNRIKLNFENRITNRIE